MPELPEVETVVRGLRDIAVGRAIERVKTNAPPSSIVVSPSFKRRSFPSLLKGRTIQSVNRRGKNILIQLDSSMTLWVHLKMTGHFYWLPRSQPIDKHDLVLFDFIPEASTNGDANYHLRFNDYRRFGRLRLFRDDELWLQDGLKDIGPEPLEISANDFIALMRRSKRMIKPALMDQSFIAGIGNIYADESLHFTKIHPKRMTSTISRRKLIQLHSEIQRLLKRSIELMGTSVDTYSGVNGQAGNFQSYLTAYNREGEPCQFCGHAIRREKIGSRSAHYCPRCQRLR
jgi:formamidopyrimidine-DNA glycosylase